MQVQECADRIRTDMVLFLNQQLASVRADRQVQQVALEDAIQQAKALSACVSQHQRQLQHHEFFGNNNQCWKSKAAESKRWDIVQRMARAEEQIRLQQHHQLMRSSGGYEKMLQSQLEQLSMEHKHLESVFQVEGLLLHNLGSELNSGDASSNGIKAALSAMQARAQECQQRSEQARVKQALCQQTLQNLQGRCSNIFKRIEATQIELNNLRPSGVGNLPDHISSEISSLSRKRADMNRRAKIIASKLCCMQPAEAALAQPLHECFNITMSTPDLVVEQYLTALGVITGMSFYDAISATRGLMHVAVI